MYRSILLAITTIFLIAATGAVAVAQSELSAPAPVTIEISDVDFGSPGLMTPDEARSAYREEGRAMTMEWQASDARLSGVVTSACNRLVNRDGSYVEAETYTLVNDDGRWVGEATGRFLGQADPGLVVGSGLLPAAPDHSDVVVLTGQDGYEGLSAVVDIDWSQEPPLAGATIFTGELPVAPAPFIG